MKDGSYGQCEVCNCRIPMARLQALYATMCIHCQREIERSGEASLRAEERVGGELEF